MTLRKLTEKSKMKFGKYYDLTVKDVLALGRPDYLRWVYYNMSQINFMDEILDLIGIPISYRITKPGNDNPKGVELEDELKAQIVNTYAPLTQQQIFAIAKNRKKQKKQRIAQQATNERSLTVSLMSLKQSNQGKKTNYTGKIYPK